MTDDPIHPNSRRIVVREHYWRLLVQWTADEDEASVSALVNRIILDALKREGRFTPTSRRVDPPGT